MPRAYLIVSSCPVLIFERVDVMGMAVCFLFLLDFGGPSFCSSSSLGHKNTGVVVGGGGMLALQAF